MLLLTTRNTYLYKNIRLYFYFRWWYLCGAEKQSQRVRGRWKSQWTTDFSRNSGTYIVYNSHVTYSNSSFSLTMVMPTSHFFAFHWLCCLLPIGFLPKPGSATITEFNDAHCSGDFLISSTDEPVFNITTVGMVTFQQSPCWYYPWADVVVST